MINFVHLGRVLMEKYEKLRPYDRYKFFLTQYYLANHKLGKETFRETDWSGILSGALWLSGFNIRCTADFFHDHIFLETVERPFEYLQYVVAFVISKETGQATHLLPHIENGVFINAINPVEFCTEEYIFEHFENEKQEVEYRTTSEKTLSAFSVSLLAAMEIDSELADLAKV